MLDLAAPALLHPGFAETIEQLRQIDGLPPTEESKLRIAGRT
jgi:hypothetical protein